MTEPHNPPLPEITRGENEKALRQLAWAIQASVGQFKLILARCNYASSRLRLVEQLRKICQVEIRVLVLKESEKTLYSAIREELGEEVPACLMVLGLESVQNLERMLISANQVREEFRNNFSFPLVLWIDDEVHKQMMQIAPDLESWATTKNFAIAKEELTNLIRQIARQFFSNTLTLSLDDYLVLESELEAAQRELLADESNLELEANLESLLGLAKEVNHKIDAAIVHYQRGWKLWQQSDCLEKQGKLLGNIAFCYYLKAFKNRDISHSDWQETRHYIYEYLKFIVRNQSLDLIPNIIVHFSEFLDNFPECDQLKILAHQALKKHTNENKLVELARVYGLLAEIDLTQEQWKEANQSAQKALDVLAAIDNWEVPNRSGEFCLASKEFVTSHDVSLYRFIQGKAQYYLGHNQVAIRNLEKARDTGKPQANLRFYLNILNLLQQLYFQQKEYLKAYTTKQQQRSVEQQFRLRAFIGAGRLQAIVETRNFVSRQENVATEITASGRQLDVKRLIERIGRSDYKLIIIHGQSGVGKSSLVNAGVVPALKHKAIGIQDNLVVAIRVYTNWVEEFGRLLVEAFAEKGRREDAENVSKQISTPSLSPFPFLKKLQECESHNLRPVLIFDQFEEFFFFSNEPAQSRQFFEFLGECLKILPVKVILSLREDYLHYLLKYNRLTSMEIIDNNILSKNVLYELGNFSPADAKAIIQQLTEGANFHLESALIDQLVKDLAGNLGEVRPIELQVVGAQLQTEEITTLVKYRECGTKEELVKRYLQEVVDDCGEENQKVAELVLYQLTDEKGTRPLKTRAELERDLKEFTTDLTVDASKLDLVLQIFVTSGLVLLLPENPAERYQLVHDYLAAFIHQQQGQKLTQLMAELEGERTQRKLSEAKFNRFLRGALVASVAAVLGFAILAAKALESAKQATINEIEALNNSSETFFASGRTLDALVDGLKAGGKLKKANLTQPDTRIPTITALQQAVYLQPQESKFREHNRLEGHSSIVYSVSFSPDGKTLASASFDNTIKLWNVATGKQIKTLSGHSNSVNSVSFSPDGKTLASASADKTIKLWDVATGKQIKTLSGHSNSVNSVSFSPDGKTLASASFD
ncbi:MAG: AAA family ATPase, partial [Rhizonema sp. NSF051]|nr:AAA family ATPase [Rhizonema sp. NSF051]